MQPPVYNTHNFCPKCGAKISDGPQCAECGVYYEKVFRQNPPLIKSKRRSPIKAIALVATVLLAILIALSALKPDDPIGGSSLDGKTGPAASEFGVKEGINALLPLIGRYVEAANAARLALLRFFKNDDTSELPKLDKSFMELLSLETELLEQPRFSGCSEDVKDALLSAVQKSRDFIYHGVAHYPDIEAVSPYLKEKIRSEEVFVTEMAGCMLTIYPDLDVESVPGIERFK